MLRNRDRSPNQHDRQRKHQIKRRAEFHCRHRRELDIRHQSGNKKHIHHNRMTQPDQNPRRKPQRRIRPLAHQRGINVQTKQQKQYRRTESEDEHHFRQKTVILINQKPHHFRQRQDGCYTKEFHADINHAVRKRHQNQRSRRVSQRRNIRIVFHLNHFMIAHRTMRFLPLPQARNIHAVATVRAIHRMRRQRCVGQVGFITPPARIARNRFHGGGKRSKRQVL